MHCYVVEASAGCEETMRKLARITFRSFCDQYTCIVYERVLFSYRRCRYMHFCLHQRNVSETNEVRLCVHFLRHAFSRKWIISDAPRKGGNRNTPSTLSLSPRLVSLMWGRREKPL